MTQNLTEAAEGIIKNKGEMFASFDVNAFEVPGGRDELWRFTPLKRLRGLHDGSAPATGSALIEVVEQRGVTVETARRGDERLGQAGVPADRVAAQAFSSFNQATIVTVARDTEVAEPIEITVTGPGEGATAYGHLQIRVGDLNFSARWEAGAPDLIISSRGEVMVPVSTSRRLISIRMNAELDRDAVSARAVPLTVG